MKRTILATVIAAASFGSLAADKGQPDGFDGSRTSQEQQVAVINKMIDNAADNGIDNQEAIIDPATGEIVIMNHDTETVLRGDQVTKRLKNIAGKNSVDRKEMRNPTPIRSTENKIKAFNALAEQHNKTVYIDKANNGDVKIKWEVDGETKSVNLSKAFTDEDGNVDYDSIDEAAQNVKRGIQERHGLAPVEEMPIITPCEEACVPDYADPEAPIEDAPVIPEGKVAKKVAEVLTDHADEIRENNPEIGDNATGKIVTASQAAQAQTQSQIDELYALGNQNANDIDTLFKEVDRLDTRIDQTQALNAATVNARPMVTNGMTAFGAGVGYAGSEAALAIGVAHSFVDTGWSASGTLAASSDDAVVGAGVQYAF